jgi:hypothetical protein
MRSLVKVLVITLLAGFLGAQFLPDVIHVPKRWPPKFPRVEFVHENAAIASAPAPVAPAAPETTAVQLPPVAAAPTIDAAEAARHAKRAAARHKKPKPPPRVNPEDEEAWFSTEPTAMIVPVRITTQIELAGTSERTPTPAAPEIRTGEEWPVLCGEVVDSSGVAIAAADVRIESTEIIERTDHNGRFCLAAPTRKFTLLVAAEGRDSVRYAVELEGRNTQVRVTLR